MAWQCCQPANIPSILDSHFIIIYSHFLMPTVQIGVEDPISDATLLTAVTAPALRGDVLLQLADTSALSQGQ